MDKERKQFGRLKSRGAEMELKQPLAKRVAAYALAAGAAGLGITAAAQPAEAQIVYTPAHIPFMYGLEAFLDIDNDGIKDFRITPYAIVIFRPAYLAVEGLKGNGVREYLGYSELGSPESLASRLRPGAKIGGGETFAPGDRNVYMATCTGTGSWVNGAWVNGGAGFLGLEFKINGKAHFGWAEVVVNQPSFCGDFMGVVTGYAYNTVPNEPIRAGQKSNTDLIGEIPPQPPTLGLLALGAPGLDIWRPRKRDLAAE